MALYSEGSARAVRVLVGTMIGVGMLALPYAVAQVGFVLGLAALFFVGVFSAIVLELYADLVLVRGGKARFIHVVGRELGVVGTGVAGMAFLGSVYGAIVAYCLFGGQFLRIATFSFVPMTPFVATMVFFAIGAVATTGGAMVVARIQRYILPIFLVLLAVLFILAVPNMHWTHFTGYAPEHIGTAFGIMVFAFFGLSAIPEARDFLGRRTGLLPQCVRRSVAGVFVVYSMFIVAILGVTGSMTTENAIVGLQHTLGHTGYVLAATLVLFIVLSAFMNVSTAMINTYLFDGRLRFVTAWALTMGIPFVFLVLGTTSMSVVLALSGGVLGSLAGIMMLVAYERARVSAHMPARMLRIPQGVVALTFCAFVAILVTTFLEIL